MNSMFLVRFSHPLVENMFLGTIGGDGSSVGHVRQQVLRLLESEGFEEDRYHPRNSPSRLCLRGEVVIDLVPIRPVQELLPHIAPLLIPYSVDS